MSDSKKTKSLPKDIWALGFVSMCMDVSSEMIHSLLPVFLVTVLGANVALVGLIEGIGEATASITKLFSGWLSDRTGKRKLLTVAGYGLGALSKPLFAMAPTTGWVLFARFSDRVGKGIRGAPRDALIADIAPADRRGAAYGLRQALDTFGALVGPLLAIALMAAFNGNFRAVFWTALLPGAAAVTILLVFVREPKSKSIAHFARSPIRMNDLSALGSTYWGIVAVAALLTLARFSEAFLILSAEHLGLALALIPVVLVIMNFAYTLSAYPAGVLSDKMDRRMVMGVGIFILFLSEIVLAIAPNLIVLMVGIILWGLHLGLTQGLLAALVAEASPPSLKGTAFGIFHFVSGVLTLGASLIAGILWEIIGPAATYFGGATFALASLLGLLLLYMNKS